MGLVPTFYTTFVAVCVFLLLPRGRRGLAFRIAIVWSAAAATAFFIPQKGFAFGILALILIAVAPPKSVDRTRFYVGTFFALPQGYAVAVPFPGLNFLAMLDFGLLAGLIALLPVLASRLGKPRPKPLRALDALVITFCVMSGLLALRDLPFTSAIRFSVVTFVSIWLPYFCISRTQTSRDELDGLLAAALQGIAMLAGIGLISAADRWNYYANMNLGDYKIFLDYRSGVLRVAATLYTPLLGALMGVGAATIAYLRMQKKIPSVVAIFLLGAFAFTAFATGSRGGWAGAVIAFATYFFLPRMKAGARRLLLAVSAATISFVVVMVIQGSISVTDYTGTFEYRSRLTQIGVRQVFNAPLFGVPSLYALPEFQPLIQGEGIIDVVNLYLQIALHSGLVGLFVFLAPLLHSAAIGLRSLALSDSRRNEEDVRRMRHIVGIAIGMMAGLLAMAATTSAQAYLYSFFFVTVAFVAAAGVASNRYLAEPVGSDVHLDRPNEPPPEAGNKKPYGARLVRFG